MFGELPTSRPGHFSLGKDPPLLIGWEAGPTL
jgi:hypothetical protein